MRHPVQFVLDFFGAGPVPTPVPTPVPATEAPQDVQARERSASDSASVADPVQGPAGYTHPMANRHTVLQGMPVSYRFERSRRRSIGLTVGPEGLAVRAPAWVPMREVDAAVQEKSVWIVAKLQQQRERVRRHDASELVWAHGARIPFLGRTLQLHLGTEAMAGEERLCLQLPPGATQAQVREAAQAWLQQQARAVFVERLNHFAPQLGVQWRRLSLSSARTRWGSASQDGHIRLNWRLVHLPLSQLDYVVVHELAHLREMNHSPRFWDTVGEVMPDYLARRQALRQAGLADSGLQNL